MPIDRIRIHNYAIYTFLCVQEQAEEEQFGPLLVGELVKHGVNATDVKKLQVDFFTNKIRFFNDDGRLIGFIITEPMLWIRIHLDSH
jgi:hypothetical protein